MLATSRVDRDALILNGIRKSRRPRLTTILKTERQARTALGEGHGDEGRMANGLLLVMPSLHDGMLALSHAQLPAEAPREAAGDSQAAGVLPPTWDTQMGGSWLLAWAWPALATGAIRGVNG